jgi:hypothetical protein
VGFGQRTNRLEQLEGPGSKETLARPLACAIIAVLKFLSRFLMGSV